MSPTKLLIKSEKYSHKEKIRLLGWVDFTFFWFLIPFQIIFYCRDIRLKVCAKIALIDVIYTPTGHSKIKYIL